MESNKVVTILGAGFIGRYIIKHLDKKEAIKFFYFNINKKIILILGGSQGSQPINTHISKNIQFYLKSD